MQNQAVITTSALTKRFGSHRGVDDITFQVDAGEVFGFLGPNGAGKSTMIRVLTGLLRATSGSAQVLGHDAWRQRAAIHTAIGVLPSDFAYEGALTGRELLEFFARLRGRRFDRQAGELAERLNADLNRPLHELSRGNHRKIGLIQALMHEPSLLILDEPTSGLDPLMQEEFLQLIAEVRDRGCTVFLSSHNMAEVERACDRVAMINEGKLMAVHEVKELLIQSHRRLQITFDKIADAGQFEALPQVKKATANGAVIELEIEGDVDPVLRLALAGHVKDIASERPNLEDVFVSLYERDGES